MEIPYSFDFAIDRGGTFTDIFCIITDNQKKNEGKPNFQETVVIKLLSENKSHYEDAPTEGIRKIISMKSQLQIKRSDIIPTKQINSIRMGTTVATNALLERKGDKVALLITKGLKDTLKIGNQSRPDIFDLKIKKPQPIYQKVIEVNERVRPLNDFEEQQIDKSNIFESHGKKFVLESLLDEKQVYQNLIDLKQNSDITSISVVLMHSYAFPNHELKIKEIALKIGFKQVSLSSQIMQRVKLVKRGQTCCVDAYLNPHIHRYLEGFMAGFDKDLLITTKVFFMQSDGSLVPINKFTGSKAILSGPAGGVVGYSITSSISQEGKTKMPVIGFDMGGTSTDVSRYEDKFDHVFETEIAGTSIQAPQLNINTVAAGGGSRLVFDKGLFKVGPESCGADPGPVCYRKPGGKLAITDANLLLGKIQPEFFPKIFGQNEDQPLDVIATQKEFEKITEQINQFFDNLEGQQQKQLSIYDVALGFIRVSNEAMARPIRSLTQARGFNPKNHALSVFGGAGAQHACQISKLLGIKKIFIHKYCGILSAYGLGLADVVKESESPYSEFLDQNGVIDKVNQEYKILEQNNLNELNTYGLTQNESQISHHKYLNLRYKGTDTSIMIECNQNKQQVFDAAYYKEMFKQQHQREFGFNFDQRPIIIDNIRVRSVGNIGTMAQPKIQIRQDGELPKPIKEIDVYFDFDGQAKQIKTLVYDLLELKAGMKIEGPSIILNNTSTICIEPSWIAIIDDFGNAELNYDGQEIDKDTKDFKQIEDVPLDAIELSIFSHRFMSIAEQMGVSLQRTAASVNIKERLDFSCALFDHEGNLVANAPHVPVHLGSMQDAVRFQIKTLGDQWKEGDVILSNHPISGGTHLPDLTVITPVFSEGKAVFYVASRGHHADIGGIQPGSMPSFSKKLEEEGAAFISFKIVENNQFQEEKLSYILCNQTGQNPLIVGTRNLADNLGDFRAQIAANQRGITLVKSLIEEYSLIYVLAQMKFIQQNAEQCVRDMLIEIAEKVEIDNQKLIVVVQAEESMDDGSKMRLKLSINRKEKSACFDFTGTDPEMYGNCNAPRSITSSAIIYCLRCLVNTDIPLNQGCLNPIKIILPENCFLNPSATAAVVGGNVLTSQRLTDLVLKAFEACAASQGCMNNLTFGDKTFGYYETIAGGHGAGYDWHGQDGVHTHMTNTRITDPEVIEIRYPVVVRNFSIREESGGKGLFNGGNGLIREIEFLKEGIDLSILSDRRVTQPYGLHGGLNGASGQNLIIYPDGKIQNFGGKNSIKVQSKTKIRILTPGGGGYGKNI